MVDITGNADKANRAHHNLTGRLQHAQVQQLAEIWFPRIHFHEKERFHPIDLERLITAPPAVFATLPESAKDSFRIEGSGPFGTARFDPPVVKDGSRVIGHGATATEALDDEVVGTGAVCTHGDNPRASREFYGASTTVSGAPEPAPGDPRVPRYPVVVRAELRCLLETLKHELQANRPDDALWGRFAVQDLFFFVASHPNAAFPDSLKRTVLAALIDAYERRDDTAWLQALQAIPQGWQLAQRAWDAVRFYAFLEYYFVYAYNDYPDYGDWPFVNEHEGDVEGCCVVFDRRGLEANPIDQVVAHTIITSVHEEFNDNDELKRLPLDRQLALGDMDVFVAPGSHATYLTAGTHEVLDPEDILTDWPGELPGWAWVLLGLSGTTSLLAALLVLAAIVEHFVDAEDETSNKGASVGPGPPPQPGGTAFAKTLLVTPLSKIDNPDRSLNLYQAALLDPSSLGFS
jgi:hypothetical protein